jgi:hypothetical protein
MAQAQKERRELHLQKYFCGRLGVLEELDACARTLVFRSKPRHAVRDHAAAGAAGIALQS